MNVQTVNWEKISSEKKFCYHFGGSSPVLMDSIKQSGIVSPLWLIRSKKLQILDGFRRFYIAQQLGVNEVPAIIFDENETEQRFLESLSVNRVTSELSVVEKLKILQIAEKYFSEKIRQELAVYLGLPHLLGGKYQIAEITGMPLHLLHYYHRNNFSLKIILRLISFNSEEYFSWLKLFADFNIKGAEVLSLLEDITDICKNQEVSAAKLFKNLDIDAILESGRTPQQKIKYIKEKIRVTRMPILTSIQSKMEKTAKTIEKEFNRLLKINWDRNLENPGISLYLNFPEEGDVDSHLENFKSEQIKHEFKKLIRTMNQLPEDFL